MQVPFLSVGASYQNLQSEMDAAYKRVMDSGWFIRGKELEKFEQQFAEYCQVAGTVGMGNGLDAIVLALNALDVGEGDEVIVPAFTFIATWLAVTRTGATIVPVEVDFGTRNLDPNLLEDSITENTKAIVPVHLYGCPAEMKPIMEIAKQHNIFVVEDAAQAQGACAYNQRAGSIGDLAAFSFYPGKNLGAFGDAGCVTGNDLELLDKVRMIGNYGSHKRYHHDVQGLNSRLDELQAAFLAVKLNHLERWNKRRQTIAGQYHQAFADTDLGLQVVPEGIESVWHLYVVTHPQRDTLAERLAERGVQTLIHYPIANHLSGAYKAEFSGQQFPISERLCAEVLSLPIDPYMSDEQVNHVIQSVHESLAI